MSENERIGEALGLILRHRPWREITIEDMKTAGVRVFVSSVGNLSAVDVLEFTLVEALERAVKELRGY